MFTILKQVKWQIVLNKFEIKIAIAKTRINRCWLLTWFEVFLSINYLLCIDL